MFLNLGLSAARVRERLGQATEEVCIPHLFDVEGLHALRHCDTTLSAEICLGTEPAYLEPPPRDEGGPLSARLARRSRLGAERKLDRRRRGLRGSGRGTGRAPAHH